jgi:biopolymer transport protein ExbD
MAEKRRILDVWVVESNTVYRDVPYSVVTDWVQQGRLLEDDQVRAAGGKDWRRVGDVKSFAAFLPRSEPQRVDDQAEALEPVEVDFSWKRRAEDEDDDVDMIPLIDVSLVLLIFFMLTSAVAGIGAIIDTPKAQHKLLAVAADMVWIGVRPGAEGKIEYLFGKKEGDKGQEFASREELLAALDQHVRDEKRAVRVNIKAHRKLPFDAVRDLTADLETFKRERKVAEVFTEVSEKEPR